jgi:hypothetical protein
MEGWAVWPNGDLQQDLNGHGLDGPDIDLQLEGLEERVCRRKQTMRNLAGDGRCCKGVKTRARWVGEVHQCQQMTGKEEGGTHH